MTETIDKLYLELSHVTSARNRREMAGARRIVQALKLIETDKRSNRTKAIKLLQTTVIDLEPDHGSSLLDD